MIKTVGYIGSFLMVIFSFTLNPFFGIVGLGMITVQTNHNKMHNLTILNIFSIIGLFFQIMS
jgi:hypothetical protein